MSNSIKQQHKQNPIRQHYIPRVYLKNFTNENNQIWIYDKLERTVKPSSPRNTTVIKHFYTIIDTEGKKDYSIEKFFEYIEGKIDKVLLKIVNEEELTIEDKEQLSYFIAFLEKRTVLASENMSDISTDLLTRIKDHGVALH